MGSRRSANLSERSKGFTRRQFLSGGVAVAGISTLGVGAIWRPRSFAQPVATPGALDDDLRVSTSGWKTDFSRHSVSLSEFQAGGPPRDGIPPVDAPRYVSLTEADTWLEAREPVIAVALAGTARAYPLQIMIWHEIVNDELAGRPLLVTFCPLCNTAIAFDRRLAPDGPVYDFGTTGNLRLSDLVMWDRQTESWWQQLTGEAIVGELTGARLTPLPAQIIGWDAFKRAYPEADVLSRETGVDRPYGENPYPGYDDIDSSPFLFTGESDGRLAPMERVVGVERAGATVAYSFAALAETGVINDRLDGLDVAIFYAPGARSALDAATIAGSRDVGQAGVFSRVVDGRTLTFRPAGNGRFTDEETGTIWDITGQSQEGPLAGRRLEPLPHTVVFWFAWAAAYPKTRLWSPPGGE